MNPSNDQARARTARSMRKRLERFLARLRWSHLRVFGESRVVQSSWLWLALVPACAKVIHHLQENIRTDPWASFVQSLRLPFSWPVLFAAALCFTAATFIYSTRGPRIIRENKSLCDFRDAAKTTRHLAEYAHEVAGEPGEEEVEPYPGCMPEVVSGRRVGDMLVVMKGDAPLSLVESEEEAPFAKHVGGDAIDRVFWNIWWIAERHKHRSLIAAAFFYMIGSLLVMVIFIENVAWVARTLWRWDVA